MNPITFLLVLIALPSCFGGCSRNYTAPTGVISTPNYPGNYPNNLNCIYHIRAEPGQRITLSFWAFSLELSNDCRYDRVKIIDGSTTLTFCGEDRRPLYTTKSNSVVVTFYSDAYEVSTGFYMKYKAIEAITDPYQTGCNDKLFEPKGSIFSPGYPSPYQGNLDCTTTITAPLGRKILLNFTAFSLRKFNYRGCYGDYLQITDGSSSKKYCGDGREMPPSLKSKTDHLTIRFKTDYSRSSFGYFATYEFVTESFQAGCNDALTEPNGAIYSPGYPAPYTNNLDCTTTITAPVGEQVLLKFTAFHVQKFTYHQCPSDYLILTDGSFSKKYCGKKKDMPSFYHSKNNQLKIHFKTNYRFAYAGYFATYKFVNDSIQTGCNDKLTKRNGEIYSPGYPAAYDNNLDCTTTISVPAGERVIFSFATFDVQRVTVYGGCRSDYLEITDGSSVRRYCGSKQDDKPVAHKSKTNQLKVRFVTDDSGTSAGYYATYTSVKDSFQTGCNDRLTNKTGVIYSLGYPNDYQKNLDCETSITVGVNERVILEFTDFKIQYTQRCVADYLQITDGSSSQKYCYNKPPSFQSKTNRLVLRFKTDSYAGYRGYTATYRTVDMREAKWEAGDGIGGSEERLGRVKSKEECFNRCSAQSRNGQKANGATVDSRTKTSCYCEYGMTGRSSAKQWMSSFIHRAPTPRPSGKINDQNCGKRSVPQSRVVGGVDALKGAWPWQIGLYSEGKEEIYCGGSLISPLWAVTAAHCVTGPVPSLKYVRLGDLNFDEDDGTEQQIRVEKIIPHEKYNSTGKIGHDIALLKLKRPANVSPVCVPNGDELVEPGTTCFITGWGKIKHPGNYHPQLQQARMKVMESQVCQEKLDETNWELSITEEMLCAGEEGTVKIGCQGDSGGPLVCRHPLTDRFVLHGVVSWGSPTCNSKETYTVFARVQALRGWIDRKMREN